MKEKSFALAKEISRKYPTQTITDADYNDEIVLLANIPTRAESQSHSLERAAGGIELHVNANKTESLIKEATSDIK